MITIIKLDPTGAEMLRYTGAILASLAYGIVIEATWKQPDRDLGYTRFETGDRFVEYFYSNRWFNIFAIANKEGVHKGWYCNIAEPARISTDTIAQVDLYLDVWINPTGETLLLDEDEFESATLLSKEQRTGARQGLRELQQMLEARQEVFAHISL
jgi:predicted RNA-binding protein associated with RNAse of E/G family